MPLDGTEISFLGDHPLAKLGAVERLLASERQWCKGRMRDRDGRHCLVGAMQAVDARQLLEPIVLRAAREVSGRHYWRVESFNDNPRTTHTDVLRVLSRAREHIIAGMIEGPPRAWYLRWAKTMRRLCTRSLTEVPVPSPSAAPRQFYAMHAPAAPSLDRHHREAEAATHQA
ncbi:MAG: hypothetical protein JO110_17680 [Acetobacteraceae bacterium]|nr:hypothetical protein [Acetobacteraceae bacterium]